MTVSTNIPLEERVIATYMSEDKAKQAKVALSRKLGLPEGDMQIINPNEGNVSEKLEGNSEGIAKNMFMMHIKYPIIGLAVGLILATFLVLFGPEFTTKSPLFTYIAVVSPGIFIGAFFAGFRSLKPEHDPVNQQAIKAQAKNVWTLLVDTEHNHTNAQDVRDELKSTEHVDIN